MLIVHYPNANGPDDKGKSVVVNGSIDGLTPEDVFKAANRIEDLDYDLARLDAAWAKALRMGIDAMGTPSMSVGDWFALVTPMGTIVHAALCSEIGWVDVPNPADVKSICTDVINAAIEFGLDVQ